MNITLRPSSDSEIEIVLQMLLELGESDGVKQIETTGEHLRKHLYGESPIANCCMICKEEIVTGFAIYSWKWATFTGRKEMYMQAIYIKPEFRGQRIATRAMSLLAQHAIESGCSRMEWYAVKGKSMSSIFYDSIGSHELTRMVIRRISGKELYHLASNET
jgi:ribosomal protein S18 acetylase RimI-like enzyme